MALLRKLVTSIVLLFLLFFGTFVIFLVFQGKNLAERKASAIFGRAVTIREARYVFPLSLELSDLNVEGLLFAAHARISGALGLLDTDHGVLSRVDLDNAVLTIHRGEDGLIHGGTAQSSTGPAQIPAPVKSFLKRDFMIGELVATNSKIIFPSHGEQPIDISVVLTQLKALNVPLSGQDIQVPFTASGRIMDGETFSGPNALTAEGWLNWSKRDLQAKANVAKWRNNMDVAFDLISVNNVLTVRGRMKSKPLTAQENTSDEENNPDLLTVLLQKSAMSMDMDFTFVTQLDRWELRNIDFSGNLSAPKEGENSFSGK